MFNSIHRSLEYSELYPTECRVFDASNFYMKAAEYHLTFSFNVPARSDNAQAEPSFYAELDTEIHNHAQRNGLMFSPHDPTPNASAPGTPAWHATRFIALDWALVSLGNKPRAALADRGRLIYHSDLPYHAFTAATFKKLPGFTNPLQAGSYHLIGTSPVTVRQKLKSDSPSTKAWSAAGKTERDDCSSSLLSTSLSPASHATFRRH